MPDSLGTAFGPGGLRVSILTTERQPAYIRDTLSSLFGSSASVAALGSIDLMIDADEASGYLSELRRDPMLKLRYLSDEEWKAQSKRCLGHRFCYNYWRSLDVTMDGYWGLVVLEDDVLLREDFVERLILTVEEVRRRQGVERIGPKGLQQFMLALYSSYNFAQEPGFYRGHYYCSYGYPFFGTCGLFYEASIVTQVRDYMWRFGVESHRLPGDLVLDELKASGTLWVYACTRDLVQHKGIVSSGLGAGAAVFSSCTFDKCWGPVRRREWAAA
jgi:hypothetical protein